MRKIIGQKFLGALSLVLAFVICAVLTLELTPKMTVSAEDHFAGRIERVDLTVDTPAIGYINNHNWSKISYSASISEESSGYEIFTSGSPYATQFKNGVAWYDMTDKCFTTNSKYANKAGEYILLHRYRVDIVVRITDIVTKESNWFKSYGDGDNWSSAVVATVNGNEATVSPYLDESIGMFLIVSYEFGETLPYSKDDIYVIETSIDAPYGGRTVSFDAKSGDEDGKRYQGGYHVATTFTSGYRVNGVVWRDETTGTVLKVGDKFITGHTYFVSICVRPDYNQQLIRVLGFINGKGASFNAQSTTSEAYLEYTFENIKAAPYDYSSVQVYGIAGPIAGATPENYPRMKVTANNSAGSFVEIEKSNGWAFYNDVCWVYSDTYYPVPKDTPFKKGEKYTLILTVKTTNGFHFETETVDGKTNPSLWITYIPEIGNEVISTEAFSPDNTPEKQAYMYIDFPACKEMITDISFSAQTPKEGEVNSTKVISTGSSKYGAKNTYWYDDTDHKALSSSDKFIANHHYTLIFDVEVSSSTNYYLPAGKKGSFLDIDGKTAENVINGNRDMKASYLPNYQSGKGPWDTFRATVDMGVCNDSVIEEVAVKIAPPVAGEKPHYTAVNAGSGYHIKTTWEGKTEQYWNNPVTYAYYGRNGVQWYGAEPGDPEYMYETDTFVEGHRYTAVIYIDADDGYEFYHDKNNSILATATVNGEEANLRNNSYDYIYQQRITYTFVCGSANSYKVSGSVVSTKNPTSPITVGLYKTGEVSPSYETTTYGTNAKYSFDSVSAGNYILKVTKSGYTTVSKIISVTDSDVIENVELSNDYIKGDVNNDGTITDQDAIYTLFHYYFGENYPVNQPCDFNGDGSFTDQDAIYLLFYYYFNDSYPLH
ncbi:MAG: hypothetical protein IJJ40_05735 [Clostridia bacterium]|nr:hypothetical protein [Clostridia bacterium]